MSKTIRRKGRSIPKHWLQDYVYVKEFGGFKYVDYPEDQMKWEIKKFHLDLGITIDYPYVPKSYKRCLNKHFRAKMNCETKRILKQHDFYEYSFNRCYLDAAYDYW